MSFDNHPPKHASVGDLRHPERLFVHSGRRSLIHKILYPYFSAYTCKDLGALILMREKPITGYMSRKQYKMHLVQMERIKQFLEQEKLEKENKEQAL